MILRPSTPFGMGAPPPPPAEKEGIGPDDEVPNEKEGAPTPLGAPKLKVEGA